MQTSSFEQVIKVLLKKGVIAQGDDVVLANSCSIILTKDENKPNLVYVDIQYKATLPPDLFYKIYNFFVCNTIYNVSCNKIAPTNIDDIKKYVSVFCKANNLNELIFSSSVQDKFIDNELLITLINDKYYSIWEGEKEKLLNFFLFSCLDVKKIKIIVLTNAEIDDYHKEQKKNEEAIIAKQKKDEENREKNDLLQKIIKHNSANFKGLMSTISEAITNQNDPRHIIEAEIIKIESKINKTGKTIFVITISDYEECVIIKTMNTADVPDTNWKSFLPIEYLSSFKAGDWIKAQCDFKPDDYQKNEITGWIRSIILIDKPAKFIRSDSAKIPRIELMCHSKMSAFDGICAVGDVCNLVEKFNMPAVGFCDRCNTQSFPDMMKSKTKIIYGYEADAQPEIIKCVINQDDQKLSDATYVIFDIETTGFYSEFEDIIEFGAIKVKNDKIISKLDFFIKPNKPIPAKITELTHITQQMVDEEGIDIKDALIKIQHYCKGSVLIAHNGINFDIRFINKKLEKYGMELLTNPLIDTLQISRAINNDYSHHSLGVICRHCKIVYEEDVAHRADFDAEVLYYVWKFFLTKLFILGIENINQINDKLQTPSLKKFQFQNYACIYARKQFGIKIIYNLISNASTLNLHGTPRTVWNLLEQDRANLFICSHPTEGEVWDKALNGTVAELKHTIEKYDWIFVSPPTSWAHEVNRNNITFKDIEKTIKLIITTATACGKKVIAVSNSYYLNKWDYEAHNVYVFNKMVGGRTHRLYSYRDSNDVMPELHFRNTQEMIDEFAFLNDDRVIQDIVIDNSNKFAELVEEKIRPIKDGLFAPKIKDSDILLSNKIYENAKSLYGDVLPDAVKSRVESELDIIISKHFEVIYWICHLLVHKSLSDGYSVGSRGSVGSSAAAFFANISEVNPLQPHYRCSKCKYSDFSVIDVEDGFDLPEKICPICGEKLTGDGHNIPFETFLGTPGAEKIPDIDLNFSGEYQPTAHKFIQNMFGKERAFRSGTVSTVAEKTAYGYVKNYYEIKKPNELINSSKISWLASKCIDVKRTTGQHPGGIIALPGDVEITDFCPYGYPPEDTTGEWFTTQYDYHKIESNLLKFDILGHDNPTVLKMLKESTGFDFKNIPTHDEKVLHMFNSIDSLCAKQPELMPDKIASFGIPEFNTKFTRDMLKTAKPKEFADLIRISGLSHGTDVWLGNAIELIKKNGLTLKDVIACREDMLSYLTGKGVPKSTAFKISEAVRKGKGVNPDNEKIMLANNVPDWYIESCKKIKYLFPKAHATAYVLDAWRIAWYKMYYPLEFYATFFTVRPDVFDVESICAGAEVIKEKLNEIHKNLSDPKTKLLVKTKQESLIPIYEICLEFYARGFKFKMIDLNKSLNDKYIIDGNSLIPPFNAIDGLGKAVADTIISARESKPFSSKNDLSNRTKISKTHMEIFNKLGILSGLNDDEQLSFF